MLYTTYFAQLKHIPEEDTKLIITRFPPKWIKLEDHKNLFLVKELSPSSGLLLDYKKNNSWDDYVERFTHEMHYRKDMANMLYRLQGYLEKGNDVYLLCYEKDCTRCHRSLIGEYFQDRGIEWEEMNTE